MSDLLGFTPPEIEAATSDAAVLAVMLEVEAAIAAASAAVGVVPAEAADAIAERAQPAAVDLEAISARAAASANPVVPLVADLKTVVPGSVAGFVHAGATSQDVMDTALAVVAARVLDRMEADLAAIGDRLADLATAHCDTVQIGRTLLQHAGPITFGMACAGWLVGVDEAAAGLRRVRRERLAVQFGGPVGTLAGLGEQGPRAVTALAAALGLAEPTMPWPSTRGRIGELAGALGVAAGAVATIALHVALLAASDVGELTEATPGGSSSMPHKRNPARSVVVAAAAHRVPGLVGTLLAAAPQELGRAIGRWQGEWPALVDALRATATAVYHARILVDGVRVNADRMRANLEAADVPAGDVGSAHVWIDRAREAHGRMWRVA
jgi:3-carboxy-cis,cis-muconate cycloisomerase